MFNILCLSPGLAHSVKGSRVKILRNIQSDTGVLIIGFSKLEKDLELAGLTSKDLTIYGDLNRKATKRYTNIDPDGRLESLLLEHLIHGLCCGTFTG